MSLRRTLLSVALACTTLLSACALRPHYRDLVQPGDVKASEGDLVVLRLVDPTTGNPIPGAKVYGGEQRERLSTTSDADGRVTMKVSKSLLAENPLVEVVLPRGVRGYQLQLVPSGQAPAPVPSTQPTAPEAGTDSTGTTGTTGESTSSTPSTGPTEGAPSTPAATPDAGT